jgi:hypothetical protein
LFQSIGAASEDRLVELGFVIAQPLQLPPGLALPFPWVRILGGRGSFAYRSKSKERSS